MVRPIKKRKVIFDPNVTYFKPRAVPLAELEEVDLGSDELEALRLCDFKELSQVKAAKEMGIHKRSFSCYLCKMKLNLPHAEKHTDNRLSRSG